MQSRQYLRCCVVALGAASAAQAASALLNDTYIEVGFGQSHVEINSYSNHTMTWISKQNAYHPFGYLQTAFFSLARWDAIHAREHYKQVVETGNAEYAANPGTPCAAHWNQSFVNSYNDFVSWAALAVLEADTAYGGTTGLEQAEAIFKFVSEHGLITPEDIQAGYLIDTKLSNNTLHATCNGESMLDGVYWQNGCAAAPGAQENPNVNAVSTGLYALVGAALCRRTGTMHYCKQAYASLQWLDRVLKTPEGLINDHIVGTNCSVAEEVFAYNAALYLAAYADLGNFTSNSTALALAKDTAVASMTTSKWNNAQGIITQGVGSNLTSNDFPIIFGDVLIRYLHLYFDYFDPETQEAIIEYVNIQYYAITQLDSNSRTHPKLYGRNWTGPGYEVATNYTVISVLDVLNGIELNPASAFPATGATTMPVATLK